MSNELEFCVFNFDLGYTVTAVLSATLIHLIWLAFDAVADFTSSRSYLQTRAGNTGVANDVYGLGVRVGIYTQATGMLLSAGCLQGSGIKIASSATMIGLLSSWTVLARNKDFSACEAVLIITLISTISLAGMPVSFITASEGGIGGLALTIANLWTLCIAFWFWSTLYNNLPNLNTDGAVWMFVRVSAFGWFRIFMLVAAGLSALMIILSTVIWAVNTYNAIKAYKEYKAFMAYVAYGGALPHVSQEEINKALREIEEAKQEAKREAKILAWIYTAIGALVLILSIASVEKIIEYNALTPQKSLSTPGQTIPLSIGLVVLVDGIFVLLRTLTAKQ